MKKEKRKKVWSITKADAEFSKHIRERDGRCVRCGRTDYLQNSHFWSRSHSATRFSEDNCDTLCYPCHYGNSKGWEFEKNGEYMMFKKKQLGKKRYEALDRLAHSIKNRTDAIIEVQAKLEMKNEKEKR